MNVMESDKRNILFVCGSMEPGRDGVGDYTRLLASELKKRGYRVSIIALRDKFIHESFIEKQEQSGIPLEVLRCTITDKLKVRGALAKKYANNFNPDWISLQFVPYAYSTYGVPIGLGAVIRSMNQNAKIHMMIHESYLTGKLSLKLNMVRIGQILGVKNLVKDLKPDVVHTSIPSYQKLLKDIGVNSDKLGLFGNLPIVRHQPEHKPNEQLKAVYFGIGPQESSFGKFSKGISQLIEKSGRSVELIFCGSLGEIGEQFLDFLNAQNIEGLQITSLGRMESDDLSALFFQADFGVARVKPGLLGKSGSAIAMLEHGLPLWVPLAENKTQIENDFDFRTELCFHELTLELLKGEPMSRLIQVTDKFEKHLFGKSTEPVQSQQI